MKPPKTPAIRVVVADARLRERLTHVLRAASVEVETGTWEDRLGDLAGASLVVVERSQLPDRRTLERELPSSVTLVVLTGHDDPADRADLQAAGVTQILDPCCSDDELGAALVALAGAGEVGGVDGPEVRGHVAEPLLADFASRSPRMLAFLELVHRVADAEASLLITGETGVGKERLARAIHAESARRQSPFVTVNVGALPENLLEDELFGHEAGAFTGAETARRGRFEQADGGTIFLDEIGELSPHLQVKLLTVLQRHAVQRLGAEQPISVDARVMAATNRDLTEEVSAGRFREDLFYRLNVVPLVIPPLREHPEDIPNLAGRFLGWFREAADRDDVRGFTGPAMDALMEHDWPGNIRELINVVERAVLLCRGHRIGLDDLPRAVRGPGPTRSRRADGEDGAPPVAELSPARRPDDLPEDCRGLTLREARRRVVDRFERAYLVDLLRETGGLVGVTAQRAGIAPRSLYEKMKRHGLRKEDYR